MFHILKDWYQKKKKKRKVKEATGKSKMQIDEIYISSGEAQVSLIANILR